MRRFRVSEAIIAGNDRMSYSPDDVNQFIVLEANIGQPAIMQFGPTISIAL